MNGVETAARVTKLGARILTQRTARVDFDVFPDGALRAVADGMFDLMYANGGVGLAAPQAGMGISLFVFDAGTAKGAMVNPVLTPDRERGRVMGKEGCLSAPGLSVSKSRWVGVDVVGFDLDGEPQSWACEGIEARIMQHECDHLVGRLCIRRQARARHASESSPNP